MRNHKYYRAAAMLLAVLMIAGLFQGCKPEEKPADSKPSVNGSTGTNTEPVDTSTQGTTELEQDTTAGTTEPITQDTTEATETDPVDPPVTTPNQGTFEPVDLSGALPAGAKVDASYFDDAVFVGDSVSLKLSYYEAAVDLLGDAQFLTSGSLGSGNALWSVSNDSVHPTYQGEKMLLEESIPLTGAKKLYIMLGMNDIALYGLDGSVANLVTLIQKILANTPGLQVFVQSMTPITSTSDLLSDSGHNPNNIQKYNQKLLAACQANGWYFVNVGEVMQDENGYLRREYCSDPDDMGIHFTNAGCAAWVEYLLTHTAG